MYSALAATFHIYAVNSNTFSLATQNFFFHPSAWLVCGALLLDAVFMSYFHNLRPISRLFDA
jgi:hypothetical protein